jgi:hypothetical protein
LDRENLWSPRDIDTIKGTNKGQVACIDIRSARCAATHQMKRFSSPWSGRIRLCSTPPLRVSIT